MKTCSGQKRIKKKKKRKKKKRKEGKEKERKGKKEEEIMSLSTNMIVVFIDARANQSEMQEKLNMNMNKKKKRFYLTLVGTMPRSLIWGATEAMNMSVISLVDFKITLTGFSLKNVLKEFMQTSLTNSPGSFCLSVYKHRKKKKKKKKKKPKK